MTTHRDLLLLARAREIARTGRAIGIRQSAGLSCADVGAAVGAAPSTIWRWERGERMPRGEAALQWASFITALQKQQAG